MEVRRKGRMGGARGGRKEGRKKWIVGLRGEES